MIWSWLDQTEFPESLWSPKSHWQGSRETVTEVREVPKDECEKRLPETKKQKKENWMSEQIVGNCQKEKWSQSQQKQKYQKRTWQRQYCKDIKVCNRH